MDRILKFILHTADVGNHLRITVICLIGDHIICPESRCTADIIEIAVTHLITVRHCCLRRIHRSIDTCVGVVTAKPQSSSHSRRDTVGKLCHKRESGLLGGNRAFMEILHGINLPVHRTPAIRHIKRTGTDIFGHVHGRILIMVTHHPLHIAHCDRFFRLDPQRHRIAFAIHGPRQRRFCRSGSKPIEIAPYSGITATQCSMVIYLICL